MSDPQPRWNFPLLRFLGRAVNNWRERHRHPFNFAIHLIGIPVAVAGVLLLLLQPLVAVLPWYGCLGLIFVGYLLQYVGHRVEGNDVGEWAAVKRALGLPYVAIAPRWQNEAKEGTKT